MNDYDDRITLSVFMPFYNEEKNIKTVVENAIKYLEGSKYIDAYELLMIDDGSIDSTHILALEIVKQNPKTKIFSHIKNRGYGAAIKTGITNSRYDYFFYTDGDGQFDIKELDKFLPKIKENPACIGYRVNRKDRMIRKINAFGWNVLNRIFYRIKIKDIDCAFKIFKRDLFKDMPLVSDGAVISTEILIRLKRKGVDFLEIPVNHLPRKEGTPTGGSIKVILKAFREFFKLRSIIFNK